MSEAIQVYESSSGKWFGSNGKLLGTGYAGGNLGLHPEGKNNPAMQNLEMIGPLPEGIYTLGTPIPQSQLGPYVIPLTPDPSNEMFGRGHFYVHGDKIGQPGCASDGCIIQARAVREAIKADPVQKVKVVAYVD